MEGEDHPALLKDPLARVAYVAPVPPVPPSDIVVENVGDVASC